MKTEDRQPRQDARRAQPADALARSYLARLSHDVRTPLNALLGLTEIALSHVDDPDRVRACLGKIAVSGRYLRELIENATDLVRLESGHLTLNMAPLSLAELTEDAVTMIQPLVRERAQSFSVRLTRIMHERFVSDALRLRQIFLNLLSAVSRIAGDGGKISLEVTEYALSRDGSADFEFLFRGDAGGDGRASAARIPGRRAAGLAERAEQVGAGVAFAEKLIELFDGGMEAEGGRGEGVFRVRLPLMIDANSVYLGRFPDLKLLIADEDCIMGEAALRQLEEIGIHADWVGGGGRTLRVLAEARRLGRPYDAVILDWRLPEMDGMETAKRIRAAFGPDLAIMILSADDCREIDAGTAAPIDGYIPKPLFVSTLCRALRTYVPRCKIPDAKPHREELPLRGYRILLAEDNVLNREVATEILRAAGAEVACAADGEQAVSRFASSRPGDFDLILMDIRMPVMDGYRAAGEIRALPRPDAARIPILALTADAFIEDIESALRAGMNGHLAKPFDRRGIVAEILRRLRPNG